MDGLRCTTLRAMSGGTTMGDAMIFRPVSGSRRSDHVPSACRGINAACQLPSVRLRPLPTTDRRIAPFTLPGQPGIVCLIGGSQESIRQWLQQAQQGDVSLYIQTTDDGVLAAAREAAETAGLLGVRVFIDCGDRKSIHLADNLADAICVASDAAADVTDAELLRVCDLGHGRRGRWAVDQTAPHRVVTIGLTCTTVLTTIRSSGGAVHGELSTQFIAGPTFTPMPEQTVVAGGRIFKAMGHIAHKANQNEMLNTLLCINAYNGTILWRRPLPEGFMLHRNTMIATADAFYMADHGSCQSDRRNHGRNQTRDSRPGRHQ